MGLISKAGDCPPNDATLYGVICETAPGFFHCGFLVSNDEGGYVLVHFAWHYFLISEPYKCDYFVFRCGLDKLNQPAAAAFCLDIVEKNKGKIPYGFDFINLEFNLDTGELEGLTEGDGMTCASFVYSILKSLGYPPIDVIDWPENDDDSAWREHIVGLLKQKTENANHVAAIDMAKPHIRIRPSQIIGAISVEQVNWPLHSEEVLPLAEWVEGCMVA